MDASRLAGRLPLRPSDHSGPSMFGETIMTGLAGVWRAAALGAACMLGFPTIAMGQEAKAGVVTALQGTATVARVSAPQPAPLKFKDDVFVQDHIVTGSSSIVRILLGGKAVVTVRERSALTIHETPTTSTIEISSGKIALAVARSRMKPGEGTSDRGGVRGFAADSTAGGERGRDRAAHRDRRDTRRDLHGRAGRQRRRVDRRWGGCEGPQQRGGPPGPH